MEAALTLVGRKLAEQIEKEAGLVLNFKKDFKWLNMQLSIFKDALKFADENDIQDAAKKKWIEEVRDTLWDAEDILDEYSVHCRKTALIYFYRYKMGRRIRTIKERTKSIKETAEQLKLFRDMVPSEALARKLYPGGQFKKPSTIEDGSLPVAIDSKVQEIQEKLTDPAVQVHAVVGMGGIGKTFLLQHVYAKVKHSYTHSVWLSVSKIYTVEQLQRDLCHRLELTDLENSKVSCTMRAEDIHNHLKTEDCLIVLDDVWEATQEDDLLRSLGIPIGANNRCKVVVTSRNKEIFSYLNPSTYHASLLSVEDSWKLFCIHAFPEEHSPPAQLEMWARQIEKECGRLPLAIKTVASSLAKATSLREWKSKLHQLKEVGDLNHDDPILHILKLSYYWLPSFLKPCFVYLSFFPEDEKINCEYFVNLWIAEGFIPQTEDQVDIAWDYLQQLENLCLVNVFEYTSLKKHCIIHDLLLDLAVQLSKENKCEFSAKEASKKGKNSGCRRMLLSKKGIDDIVIGESNICCAEVVRTLSLSQNSILNSIPPYMLSNARLLRVLDLSSTAISTLPESVGDLKLLRILNIFDTNLKEVPLCVRKLKSLNFLDVSRCSDLSSLPLWIGELVSLQHLDISSCSAEIPSHVPKGVSKLMSLRTLRTSYPLRLSVEDNDFLRLEDVGNMTSLQEIRMRVQNEVEMKSLAQGVLGRLVKMRTLLLECEIEGLAQIPFPESIRAMKDLQTLSLEGKFAVPGWTRDFENLRVLRLSRCDCSELYPELETMGNLTELSLCGDKNCRVLPTAFGKRGGFTNLRIFEILSFQALEELPEMEDGAMPSLESLLVYCCRRVRNVPRGFQGLKRLRSFQFSRSGTAEYRSRLQEEWSTVQANNQHLDVCFD